MTVLRFISALLLVVAPAVGSAPEPIANADRDGLVDTAKSLIASGEWATAAATFDTLHRAGHRSPETLTAQGVALVKAGRPAEAKAAFLQSLALAPGQAADVIAKLDQLEPNASASDRQDQLTVLAAASPAAPLWIALSIAFWITVVALVVRKTLVRHWLATATVIVGALVTLAAGAAVIARATLPPATSIAVIVSDDTLRGVPLDSATKGPSLAAGAAAAVEEQSGEFTLVKQLGTPHNSGWVRTNLLIMVLPES